MSCDDHGWFEEDPCPGCEDEYEYPRSNRWDEGVYLNRNTGELFYQDETGERTQVTSHIQFSENGNKWNPRIHPSDILDLLEKSLIDQDQQSLESWLKLQTRISEILSKLCEQEGPPTSRAEHLQSRAVEDE